MCHLLSASTGRFSLRRRSVAAAQVGSCSSSVSRFSRLEVEEEQEDGGGRAAGLLAGGFFVKGAAEVEGEGSKPTNRDKGEVKTKLETSMMAPFLLYEEKHTSTSRVRHQLLISVCVCVCGQTQGQPGSLEIEQDLTHPVQVRSEGSCKMRCSDPTHYYR